jgi:hypothetical protein
MDTYISALAESFLARSGPKHVRNTEATSREYSWQRKAEADKQQAEAEKQKLKEAFEQLLAEKGYRKKRTLLLR